MISYGSCVPAFSLKWFIALSIHFQAVAGGRAKRGFWSPTVASKSIPTGRPQQMSINPDASSSALSPALARTADFDLLDRALAEDVKAALSTALRQDVAFCEGNTPLAIFRHALATAISRIHENGRCSLFLRFLKDGCKLV